MAAATATVVEAAKRTGLRTRPAGGSGTEAGLLSESGKRHDVWKRRDIGEALGEVFLGNRAFGEGEIWEHGMRILQAKKRIGHLETKAVK